MKLRRLTRFSAGLHWIAIGAWGAAVLAGMASMVKYDMTPGATVRQVPARWPSSAPFALDASRPTLVMALHPQCPCSRASLHELEAIIAHSAEPLAIHLLFVSSPNAPANWPEGPLWRQAAAMANVSIAVDGDGELAEKFGAATSGEVSLYDTRGNLLFHGGITDGRGHEGDSIGASAIVAMLREAHPAFVRTPVYGCALCSSISKSPGAATGRGEQVK
jgi:hypothetical protein